MGVGVNACIFAYIAGVKPYVLGDRRDWEVASPWAIPTASAIGVVCFFLFIIGLWPSYGLLSPVREFSQACVCACVLWVYVCACMRRFGFHAAHARPCSPQVVAVVLFFGAVFAIGLIPGSGRSSAHGHEYSRLATDDGLSSQ